MLDGNIDGTVTRLHAIAGDVSVLGSISGDVDIVSGIVPTYQGEYEVVPRAYSAVILETQGKKMLDNVTVQKVPYYETSNLYGDTVYIASEV